MDFWILKEKIQSKKIRTKSKILYLFIFRIWIGFKKKFVFVYFFMDTKRKTCFWIWISLDWIQIQNVESVSSGCGYNFSKMYPYPKSSRWNEQLECGEKGATWRRRVVLISTGRTERLSQRLTKLKPHLTPAPYIDQTPVRIHFRKVVSTSTGYRSKILNLYPIRGHTDTIFESCIQSKIKRIRFLKLESNLELFGYNFSNFFYKNPKLSAILWQN